MDEHERTHIMLAGVLGVRPSDLRVEHTLASRRGAQGAKVSVARVYGRPNGVARDYSKLPRQFLAHNHAQVTPCRYDAAVAARFAARDFASASRALGGLVLVTVRALGGLVLVKAPYDLCCTGDGCGSGDEEQPEDADDKGEGDAKESPRIVDGFTHAGDGVGD